MNTESTSLVVDSDRRRAELVEIVIHHGVCPREQACEPPNPESADCQGCLMAWAALKSLEMGE